jgi:hypothetical protein
VQGFPEAIPNDRHLANLKEHWLNTHPTALCRGDTSLVTVVLFLEEISVDGGKRAGKLEIPRISSSSLIARVEANVRFSQ